MEEGRARSEEIRHPFSMLHELVVQMLAFPRVFHLRFLISYILDARYNFSGLFNNSGLLFGIFLKVPTTAGILIGSPLGWLSHTTVHMHEGANHVSCYGQKCVSLEDLICPGMCHL